VEILSFFPKKEIEKFLKFFFYCKFNLIFLFPIFLGQFFNITKLEKETLFRPKETLVVSSTMASLHYGINLFYL